MSHALSEVQKQEWTDWFDAVVRNSPSHKPNPSLVKASLLTQFLAFRTTSWAPMTPIYINNIVPEAVSLSERDLPSLSAVSALDTWRHVLEAAQQHMQQPSSNIPTPVIQRRSVDPMDIYSIPSRTSKQPFSYTPMAGKEACQPPEEVSHTVTDQPDFDFNLPNDKEITGDDDEEDEGLYDECVIPNSSVHPFNQSSKQLVRRSMYTGPAKRPIPETSTVLEEIATSDFVIFLKENERRTREDPFYLGQIVTYENTTSKALIQWYGKTNDRTPWQEARWDVWFDRYTKQQWINEGCPSSKRNKIGKPNKRSMEVMTLDAKDIFYFGFSLNRSDKRFSATDVKHLQQLLNDEHVPMK